MLCKTFKSFLFLFILNSAFIVHSQDQNREYYQLKIYSFDSEKQIQLTENYLENAYLPALRKQNIGSIGVFKPHNDSIKKIYILVPLSSLSQLETIQNELSMDKNYISKGKDYLEASYNNPSYDRLENLFLKAFKYMPKMKASALKSPRKDRIYELRSYESSSESYFTNKVEMFNEGGEVALFDRLNFNAVFYGEVISGSKMPNLMYMTTFKNQTSRDSHWKEFVASPEWKELSSDEKYKNNVSHSDKYFLYPTAYSDY